MPRRGCVGRVRADDLRVRRGLLVRQRIEWNVAANNSGANQRRR
jgi:hypothetical protein